MRHKTPGCSGVGKFSGARGRGPTERRLASFATEVERLRAGREPLRRYRLELPPARQAVKQGWPTATDDRVNDDAVLVDEAPLLERRRELRRADENTPLGLCFQCRDCLAKVPL